MANENEATQTRDTHTGQFVHTFKTMCRCGHTVGDHAAVTVKGRRDCFADGCDCVKVRKITCRKVTK
jgi:hypothetical protein